MNTVLDLPTPRVLRTQEEYESAVQGIDRLLRENPQAGTDAYDRLELLSLLVEDYDARHYPVDDSDVTPQDIVDFMLDQHGMTRADLAPLMGGRSRVSDFFNGKRGLSKAQIAALRERFGIPADLLF